MKENKYPYLIGITGSFGTGKSIVGNIIAEFDKNTLIIDADDVVKGILSSKNNVTDALIQRFGKNILLNDGDYINRKVLAECIFRNPENRTFTENLIHPEVIKILKNYISVSQDKPIIVILVPLLYEAKMEKLFDEIWCVICDESVQFQRLIKKGFTTDEITRRVTAQISQSEKAKLAGFIIDNSGDLEKTKDQIIKKLSSMAQLNHTRHFSSDT